MYDVVIAGGGVIGSMLARELCKYKLKICVLEKQNDVAMGSSKANSAIVHGGYDPEPGTLKARLNVRGVELMKKATAELNVPFRLNGSLVAAFSEKEDETVKELYERGIKNGVTGLEIVNGDRAREIEPALSGDVTSVLVVNNAGIVCPYDLTIAAMGNAMDNGAELMCGFEVVGIEKKDDAFVVSSADGKSVEARYFVNCAGLYSDKIAALAGDGFFEIIPRAGEYLLLDKSEGKTVDKTIFQVPSENGKGILVTPTVDGNLLLGPTAERVESPEHNETTAKGLETVTTLAKKSVPSVKSFNVITSFCGVRSSEKNGDFIIGESEKVKGFVNVAAIDSPGLSSACAIAEYTVEILKNAGLALEANTAFNPNRTDMHAFRKMSLEEKDEFIKKNPAYGKIVCRCETVSEGEIINAIKTNPPARDVDGVKRRTRSGMGRCQGGFCGPAVMKLISEYARIPMEKVTKSGGKSYMLTGKRG